jgi:PAS domain S-box-containing protein
MDKLIHVLVVGNSQADAARMLEEIKGAGYEPVSERVQTANELTAALGRRTWDVVLSDYALPQLNGVDALKLVREKNPDVPFIVISGVPGEEVAVRLMRAGANDYLLKTNLLGLVPAMEREMEAAKSRRASARAENITRFLASLVESSDEAIYGMKLDGTVMSWNRAAERIYGFRAGEIVGQNVSILYPDERLDELVDTVERIKRGDHAGHMETTRVRQGGRIIPVAVTISPMMNGDGKITGASVIAHDITSRKRDETDRIKLIQELADSLAHAKILAGLLPICASCKRIRDDHGYWQQVEAYISEHSDAVFSHGICPDCFKEASSQLHNDHAEETKIAANF